MVHILCRSQVIRRKEKIAITHALKKPQINETTKDWEVQTSFPLNKEMHKVFFSNICPQSFIFYCKKKSNNGFCSSFTLNRDARKGLLPALPYNILDWFTWSIIYQFLWDCTQNKVPFSVMVAESILDVMQPHTCSKKGDIHVQGQ